MNCPACLTLMINRDEIHHIRDNMYRMNLHCPNTSCPAQHYKKHYVPYMQVITNDPSPWKAKEYGLVIPTKENDYILLAGNLISQQTALFKVQEIDSYKFQWRSVFAFNKFLELSTGDDMHLDAISVVNKILDLKAFI